MTVLHMHCTRSEMIFLCRLNLKSHLSDWILTMRAENELNLRSTHLKLKRSFEAAAAWICRDPAGSLFNLGVMLFSGCNFGGWVIMSEIGYKNKKDFLATTWRAGERSFIFEEGYLISNFSADDSV